MNQQIGLGGMLPPVVKNLLIINGLFFLATMALSSSFGIDLVKYLGLHVFQSQDFRPHQFISYIFMHGGVSHILFNMFALWMFGANIENYWGGKRFLIYYLITGFGAGLIHLGVVEAQLMSISQNLSLDDIALIKEEGLAILESGKNYSDHNFGKYNILINTPTVGASGSVFGLLLAFGMMFPNVKIYLYFLFPIKAKYFVMMYGAFELYSGISNNPGDNVAHFAHLGGMLFGYILIKYWKKHPTRF